MPARQTRVGEGIELSRSEVFKFEKDVNRFIKEFGEAKFESRLRKQVTLKPLKEARAILAQETDNSGYLEATGLRVVKESGTDDISILLGGGRGRKYKHGFLAHWVELGTSGVVRDGGRRYKKGTAYRAPTEGIHFLERAAENTRDEVFAALTKSMDRAFSKLGK